MLAGKALSQNKERVHVDKILSDKSGLPTSTLYKVDQIIQAAQADPDRKLAIHYEGAVHPDRHPTYGSIATAVRQEKIPLEKAYKLIDRDRKIIQKRLEVKQATADLKLSDRVILLNKDSMHDDEVPEIRNNSIDLILTDPPYLKENIGLYDSLARFAIRKLKPGGALVFIYGRYQEPQVHEIFSKYKD